MPFKNELQEFLSRMLPFIAYYVKHGVMPVPPYTCEDCDQADETVKPTICPFDSDVHDKATGCFLCPTCERERGLSI